MRPRPYSTRQYLEALSGALKNHEPRIHDRHESPVHENLLLAVWGWVVLFGLIWLLFWLASAVPGPDLRDRRLIDPTHPQKGDVWYHDGHFWFWTAPPGKSAPEWVDP